MRHWILLFLLIPFCGRTQEFLRLPQAILSAQKSHNEQLLALTTADSLYILNAHTLHTKKWKHGMNFPHILGFHPGNQNLLVLQENILPPLLVPGLSDYTRLQQHLEYEKDWQETPNDSLHIWNIEGGKKIQSAPGNFYLQFGKGTNTMAGCLNRVYRNGYFADSSELFTQKENQSHNSTLPKACRRIQIDAAAKYLAASWYNPKSPSGQSHSFSLHHFITHQPLLELNQLAEQPTDFQFSPSGKWIAICARFSGQSKKMIRLYDLSDYQLKKEIPHTGKSLHFSADEKTIEYLDENRIWVQWDLTQHKKIRTIWTNLTSLFSFENILPFEDRILFTGTAWSGSPLTSTPYHQLETVNKNDLELFSTIDQPSSQPLADTNRFVLLLNDVNTDYTDPSIRFNNDRTLLTAVNNNQLQVWNTTLRKKLLQRQFHAKLKAFPDRSGNSILLMEEKTQMTFSDYLLHHLSPATNTLFTSGALTQTDSTLNGTSPTCNCLPDPDKDDRWICTDGSSTLWQIEGKNAQQSIFTTIPKARIRTHVIDKTGTQWLLVTQTDEKTAIWQLPKNSTAARFVRNTEDQQLAAGENGYWSWRNNKDSTITYWENDQEAKTIAIPGPIQHAEPLPDKPLLLVHYEHDSYDTYQLIHPANHPITTALRDIGANFYPLSNQSVLIEKDGFASDRQEAGTVLDWSIPSPIILSSTNFSVSANGRFILLGNNILDLKEIAQVNIDKYNPSQLLQDTGKLQWIELVEKRDLLKSKSGYNLIRIDNNGMDTAWGKKWIYPEIDGYVYSNQTLTLSPNRQWVIAHWNPILSNNQVHPPVLWNTNTLEAISLPLEKGIQSATFSSDGKSLMLRSAETSADGLNQKLKISHYTLTPFKKIRQQERTIPIGSLLPTEKNHYTIQSRNINWHIFENDSVRLQKTFYSRAYLECVAFHEPSNQLIAGTSEGSVLFWDRDGYRSPTKSIQVHAAATARLELRGNKLYSLGEDGSIAILDIREKKLLVQLLTIQRQDDIATILYTPEGFYRADAGITPLAHFTRNGSIYPLSSFEYQGNRPDKVYAALGFADSTFLELLRNSWEARLKRAGMPLTDKPLITNTPRVEWKRNGLLPITSDSVFHLSVQIIDPIATAGQLSIRINGVPLNRKKGESIRLTAERTTLERTIPLSKGKNRISVQFINAAGMESVEQEWETIYRPRTAKTTRLFYAGVGVSAYADSNYNLRYAAKDIHDIAEKMKEQFDSVHVLTLINENAIKPNILQLHEWLQQSNTDDIVILSFSGHGMVDPEKGFIYATHDMDFGAPAKKGVFMDELESILDDIPARKRLLLLDACHSGEAWADTLSAGRLPIGVSVTPRGFGAEESTNTGIQKQAFLLMKELFSDLTRGNGAFMISAAGSNEFAFEGNQWKNGVFTRSLLESLQELRYNDRSSGPAPVSVSQLRKKVYEKVRVLTKGLQNPTSRQENGWWDWSL
jgi:hypothetical protein